MPDTHPYAGKPAACIQAWRANGNTERKAATEAGMEHAEAIHGLISAAGNLKCNNNEEVKGQLVYQEMLAKKLVSPNKAKFYSQ